MLSNKVSSLKLSKNNQLLFRSGQIFERRIEEKLDTDSSSSLSMSDISEIANDTPLMARRTKFQDVYRSEEVQEQENAVENTKEKLKNEFTEENEKILKHEHGSRNEKESLRLGEEKDLVISLVKRNLIIEEYFRLGRYKKHDDPVNVSYVEISNIRYNIPLNRHDYYLCLLTHETTVLASEVIGGSTSNEMIFEGNFKFTSLDRDFKINMELYQLTGPIIRNKLLPRLLAFFKSRRRNPANNFKLKFRTPIMFGNIRNGYVREEHRLHSGRSLISAKVTGKLGLIPKLFCNFVDFASAEEKQVIRWTRKWCVLEGTELKIWNSPQEEGQLQDALFINLLNTTFRKAKRKEFPRTILITPSGSLVTYFIHLATDDKLNIFLRDIELAVCTAKKNEMMNE